jgi:hypothetical protein
MRAHVVARAMATVRTTAATQRPGKMNRGRRKKGWLVGLRAWQRWQQHLQEAIFPAWLDGWHHQRVRSGMAASWARRSYPWLNGWASQRGGAIVPHLSGHGPKCRRRLREAEQGRRRGRNRRHGVEEAEVLACRGSQLLGILESHGRPLGLHRGVSVLVASLRVPLLSPPPFSFSFGEQVAWTGEDLPQGG